MTNKDKRKLLLALEDKTNEAIKNEAEAVGRGTVKMTPTPEHAAFWKGYHAGIQDAKEVVEEFGRPTEDVLG